MSFGVAWTWTFARASLLTLLALPCCAWIVQVLRSLTSRHRTAFYILLAIPFLFPELLTAYAYSQSTRLLIRNPGIREAWLDVLLFLRSLPVGIAFWYWAPPPPLSRTAIHLRTLAFRGSDSAFHRLKIRLWYELQGPWRTAVFASAALFLVHFHEFELTSLLAVTSWTVWLFDAQAGGLSLVDSMRCAVEPSICTLLMCGPLLWGVLSRPQQSQEAFHHSITPSRSLVRIVAGVYLILANTLIVIVPLGLITAESGLGFSAWTNNYIQVRNLFQGVFVAGGFALLSGTAADLLGGWCFQLPLTSRRWLSTLMVIVGLPGSLIISLLLVSLFQTPVLRIFADSPIPLLVGLTVWLLPRAIMLHGLVAGIRQDQTEMTVQLLLSAPDASRRQNGRDLWWIMTGRQRLAIRLLLCYWAYWDLSMPSILVPSGMTPAPVRLFIDMHFGRNGILTVKALLTLLLPLCATFLCWPLFKYWSIPHFARQIRRVPHSVPEEHAS